MTRKLLPVSICIFALMNCLINSAFPAQDKDQTTDTTDLRNSFREEILMESFDAETEDPDILEDLETFRRNPLDLNKVTFDELTLIPFLNPLPVSGNDFLINADWRAEKGFVINLKIKSEIKGDITTVKDSVQRDVKLTDNRHQFNARLGFIYQLSDALRFRSRFEFVNVRYRESGTGSKGTLFFSDMRVNPFPGLIFDMRIIFFDTEDYDSRIYEYENDIKGVMSNTALYGKGKRWYAVLRYKPFRLFEISAKYSETYTDGVKFTGSGNDRIDGDINNRLNVGVEILF